jgi:ketosteroid isomerase-like protein
MGALIDVVHELQRANERRDRDAILALVTPDLEYHYHVGSKPLRGPDKLARFLDGYWARMRDTVWKIEKWAETGDTLLMEGWEEYTDSTTGRRVTNRYMGSMVFRDGRIAVWKDYFQMGPPPGGGPGATVAGSGTSGASGADGGA